jgi:excisionase family DNA binding protein
MTERLTYTVEEAARLCGVSRGVAYQAVAAGEIPSLKVGRRILVPRARLLALLGEDLSIPESSKGGENKDEVNRLGATTVSATRRGDGSMALEQ